MANFSQGGGAFTERWRDQLTKVSNAMKGWVPIDLLLAWIDVESNGKPDEVTSIGERGLFQVHPDEREILHLSDDEFQRLTTDFDLALRTGVNQAMTYGIFAKRFLADVGEEWHGRDFWKLVKLHHGAFAMPKFTLLAFKRENGRGPANWRELQAFAFNAAKNNIKLADDPKLNATLRALVPSTFANAEKTGERSEIPEIDSKKVSATTDLLRSFGLMV